MGPHERRDYDEDRRGEHGAAPRPALRGSRAEQALREAQEHLRLAQEAGGVAVWWADERTGRLHVSPQFARLWGVPAGVELTTAEQLELIHPADRERVSAAYAAALDGRAPLYEVEYRVARPGGSPVWLAARGEVVRDETGRALGVRGVSFDVTALKTATTAIEESERRFGEIADAAPVMMWIAETDRNVSWFNRAWVEFTGVPMARHLGYGWLEAIHPDDRDATLKTYEGAFAARTPYRMEYRLRRHDGQWRCLDESASPHYGSDGQFRGFVGAAADVTEAKAALAAMRESERRFRAFVEAGKDVLWIADPQGRLTWLSPAFESAYGVPRQAAYDDPDFLIRHVHPDDAGPMREAFAAARRGETVEFEYRYRGPDGEERVFNDTAFPVFDDQGRVSWTGGRARDVTARRRAEQALAHKEALFRGLSEATDDMVAMFDPEVTHATYVNSAFERVWGGDPEAFRRDFNYWRQVVHPDDAHIVEEGVQQLRAGRPYKIQFRVILPTDGSTHVVEDRAFPVRDEATGEVWVIGSIMRDVTDSVAAREELERRVAERTRELEASLEERRKAEAALAQAQRLETVGRLTGGVAHDFNNLLTVMIGALDMILRRPDQIDRVTSLGQAALEAGRRGERLTRQLLGFSRRQPMRTETVCLRTLIRGFEPMLRGAVGEATPLELEVADDLGWAQLDPVQFEAALLNLVVNAADALGPDGRIRVTAGRVQLKSGELREAEPGDYARIAVIDNGAGMDPEVAAHAFEPFFTTKGPEGTGLGLAQVYGFARQSGGVARIASAPGEGSTVALFLPLTEAPVEVAAPAPRDDERPLEHACRVLLVEDDPGVRAVAAGLLVDLGCDVLTAADGPSALELLKSNPEVKLLLSDVVMPGGMSGVDLAEAATAMRPELKVLLSTGYASDRLESANARWPVLPKPYQAEELLAAVKQGLG